MARSANASRPGLSLAALGGLFLLIYGLIAAGVVWSDAQWTPKLALDLEGGTQMILTPVPQAGQTGQVSQASLQQAVEIIRQRVNGTGVSEAEVTTQGNANIIVAMPGKVTERQKELVKASAQLQFRAVLRGPERPPGDDPDPDVHRLPER